MHPFKLVIGLKASYVAGQYVGSRLRAAIPNNAGYKFKPYTDRQTKERKFYISERNVPSFQPPYLVAEGSDLQIITTKDVERFIQGLEQMGYKDFEFTQQVLDIARAEYSLTA